MRIAVVAGPDPGHAFPAFSLGCALRRRGHDVAAVTGTQWADRVLRDGLEFRELTALAPTSRDHDFGYLMWGRGREMAPATAQVLREWGADGVVHDTLTVAGWFGADLAGVPRVELIPHLLQDASPALAPIGAGLPAARTPLRRLHYAALHRLGERSRAAGAAACAAARQELGLAARCAPRARLVATLPGLELPRPEWPERTVVVGLLEWEPASRLLAAPPGDGPLVVVVDTSATGRPQTLLELAVEALAGTGVRIASVRLSAWPGATLPAWVTVGPGQLAPLLVAASAVVCAGGHGTVARALVRGVPLVVVPGPGDQKENAARVHRAGAGVALPPGGLTAERLREAVLRLLRDPSYAAGAQRLARTAVGLGPDHAAAVTERALG